MKKLSLIFLSFYSLSFANETYITSIPILKTWLQVIRPGLQVEVLYKANQDPHQFDLAPSSLKKILHCKEAILLGANYDSNLESFFQSKKIPVFKIFENSEAIHYSSLLGDQFNSHIFLSLKKNIQALEKLKKHFNVEFFTLPEFWLKLKKLDLQMETIFKTCKPNILSDHGASLVFYNDYKVNLLGAFEESHGMDLSIKKFEGLQSSLDDKAIFINETGRKYSNLKNISKVINLKNLTSQEALFQLAEETQKFCSKQ